MGALSDVFVTDASAADWQAVFDLVRSAGWEWAYPTGSLPSAAERFRVPPMRRGTSFGSGPLRACWRSSARWPRT